MTDFFKSSRTARKEVLMGSESMLWTAFDKVEFVDLVTEAG